MLSVFCAVVLSQTETAYAGTGVANKISSISVRYGSDSYFSSTGKPCGPGQTNGFCTFCQLAVMDPAAAAACGNGDSCYSFAKYVFYNTFGLDSRSCSSVGTSDINSVAKIGDFIECYSSSSAPYPSHYCIYMGSAGGNSFYAYESNVEVENVVKYCSLHNGGTGGGYFLWPYYRVYHASNYALIDNDNSGYTGSEMPTGYDRTLPDGDYLIASAADTSLYVDIAGSDVPAAAGTNVSLYLMTKAEASPSEIFTIK